MTKEIIKGELTSLGKALLLDGRFRSGIIKRTHVTFKVIGVDEKYVYIRLFGCTEDGEKVIEIGDGEPIKLKAGESISARFITQDTRIEL